MDLEDLLGKHVLTGVDFSNVIVNIFGYEEKVCSMDFVLDGNIISAIEDPEDSYRSSMRELLVNRKNVVVNNRFSKVEVIGIEKSDNEYNNNDIIDFIDVITGKIILSVGTENYDDYYPMYIAQFFPENMCLNN